MIRRVGCICVSMLAWAAVLNANAEPGQDAPPDFIQVLPTTIQWLPSPVPGLHVANLLGSPREPGPFVIRVKLLPGAKVMPLTHSRPSSYTVLAGEWTLGFGTTFDAARLLTFSSRKLRPPPGGRASLSRGWRR